MASKIQHSAKAMQFFVNLNNGAKAHLDYKIVNKTLMDMEHTFVPPEGRGQGLAEKIVREAFSYAKTNNYQVIPTCSYVAKYVQDIASPDEKKIVAKI